MNEPSTPSTAAMIVSVGGTPAPIIESIRHFRPAFVCFLASQQTCDQVTGIKNQVRSDGLEFDCQTVLIDDAQDMLHCYEKSEDAVTRVVARGYAPEDVVVDYTGGTKNMTAALSLAAITHGFSFSYVGGNRRTKDGTGIVIDGAEQVRRSVNPWDFLAVEERKKISLLFNSHQFKAASRLCDDLSGKNVNRRSVYKKLGFMIAGYHEWDLFRYRSALDRFARTRIEELTETDNDPGVLTFAKATQKLLPFLESAVKSKERPGMAYILDLFANAERRFEEGKTDDAVLRLYRIMEMAGQYRLMESYGIDTANVPPDRLPSCLRGPYEKKYKDPGATGLKLPLAAGYNLLKELGDDLGRMFCNQKDGFANIQQARNLSFLAHGFQSAKETTYESLRAFVVSLGLFKQEDTPRFPVLNF